MEKEIRKEIREYILKDVNVMLARLGVSESAKETEQEEDKYEGKVRYKFETPAIKQYPMMFRKVYVNGYMVASEISEEGRFSALSKENELVCVILDWSWESFSRGSNGASLGRVIYAVRKDLPEKFDKKDFLGNDPCEYYVRKVEGLEL